MTSIPPPSDPPESRDARGTRRNKGRLFQCTGYPNCNKSFTRSEHLLRHRRKHTGERPFSCPHCAKNFLRLDNLRQHRQTVHAYETHVKLTSEEEPKNGRISQNQILPAAKASAIAASTLTAATESRSAQEKPQIYLPINSCGLPQTLPFAFGAVLNIGVPHQIVSPPLSGLTRRPAYPTLYFSETQPLVPLAQLPSNGGIFSLPAAISTTTLATAGSIPVSEQREILREPPKFNPKSRPRPLALAQSYSDDNFHNRGTTSSVPHVRIDPPLHTAPPRASLPLLLQFHDAGRPVLRPIMASTMVSPLSPLFHQSFNQVAATSTGGRSLGLGLGHTLSPALLSPWVHAANVPPANFAKLPRIPSIVPGSNIALPVNESSNLTQLKYHKPTVLATPVDVKPALERKVAINNLLSEDPPVSEDTRPEIKVENS